MVPMVISCRIFPWLTRMKRTVCPRCTYIASGVKRIESSTAISIVRVASATTPGTPTADSRRKAAKEA
ncbi:MULTISPECIES: hypothetical protein [Thiomonas]|uniref:hypothetical protein n=1 Tax=Thiomonas TaxID=32012 RepID=UPI0012FF35A9|nr:MULTISPECIES: hypothetical protein [Thiomonas]